MKYTDGSLNLRGLIIVCIALIAFVSLPVLSRGNAAPLATSVNIVNNSTKEIRNVYTSHTDVDDWSNDLLGEATITAGQSLQVTNLACDGQAVKVIAEDQDGCFLTSVVSCGQNATWTVTDDTAKDCGY